MSRITKIVVVCEGWRDWAFIRGFLAEANVDPRAIDPKLNPGGSGHDWVTVNFAEEVRNLERFSEGRGVLGLVDEDGQGVKNRIKTISDELERRGLRQFDCGEGRCLLLPTRNLETWLYWLVARAAGAEPSINENTDYKSSPPPNTPRLKDGDCRPAGRFLHSLNHLEAPADCPPMLTRALGHLREFLNAVRR